MTVTPPGFKCGLLWAIAARRHSGDAVKNAIVPANDAIRCRNGAEYEAGYDANLRTAAILLRIEF